MCTITLIMMRLDPATKTYDARRVSEGEGPNAQRRLKRDTRRQISRILGRGELGT
jgi:hypothetical protein